MLNKISMRARRVTASRVLILPAAAICLLFSSAANAADWQRLAPAGAGFAIMMPGTPQTMDRNVQTHFGPRVMHIWAFETKDSAYMAMYADYQAQIPDPKKSLEEVRDGQVGKGKLVAEENVSAGGYPGKKTLISTADGKTVVSQFFLVGSKLYQMMYVTLGAPQAAVQAAAPFMKSFQLGR
jgi:hypothetical protein